MLSGWVVDIVVDGLCMNRRYTHSPVALCCDGVETNTSYTHVVRSFCTQFFRFSYLLPLVFSPLSTVPIISTLIKKRIIIELSRMEPTL